MQNQNIDHGNKFDWEKLLRIMPVFGTSIRHRSMK